MKVRTFPARSAPNEWAERWDREHGVIIPHSSVPFIWSRAGTMTHRVRWVRIITADNRWSADAWCGQMLRSGLATLAAEPHPDRPVCGTCHGRAIGAGQIDAEGTPLLFSPRIDANLGRCVWEHPGRGPYSYPWRCHRTAVERIPEAPDMRVGVCAEHARRWPQTVRWRYEASLRNAGLVVSTTVQPADPMPRFDPGPDDTFDDLLDVHP